MCRAAQFLLLGNLILILVGHAIGGALNLPNEQATKDADPVKLRWQLENDVTLLNLSIGTPAQNFKLWLMVEPSFMWVFDKNCIDSQCVSNTNTSNVYDSSLSSTSSSRNTTFKSVDDGAGNLYTDLVQFPSLQFRQQFASLNKVTKNIKPASGVFGLGYDQLETSPFYGLTSKHKNKRIMLSASIDTNQNVLSSAYSGFLTIGPAFDEKTKIHYVNTTNHKNWHFQITKTIVDLKTHIKDTNNIGSFNVGYKNTIGPRLVTDLIFSAAGAIEFGDGQHYVFKSSLKKIPKIHFTLSDGVSVVLNNEAILHEDNEALAYNLTGQRDVRIFALESSFSESGDKPSWRFGDRFMQKYPILLDGSNPQFRIGFINLQSSVEEIFKVTTLLWTLLFWALLA